jgi:surface polysaccharide O-acyltransferase-like enzyme
VGFHLVNTFLSDKIVVPIDEKQIVKKLQTRDLSIDFIRVFAIILVVILHTMMVGLAVTDNGVKQINILEQESWFSVASWFGQIMPLFFVAGGFASWVGYQSLMKRNGTARDYVRSRAIRLLYPVAIFYSIFFALISLLVIVLGVDANLMNMFLGGIGMPLWFVVGYLICQILVPFLIKAHQTHPFITVLIMFIGIIIVDGIHVVTGQAWVGWFNLFFVWPLVQQIGFFITAPPKQLKYFKSKWWLVLGAAASFTGTWLLTCIGYNSNMLANLNPPSLPLVFIGLGQTCLFLLLRSHIQKLMTVRAIKNLTLLVGSRAMTIYLWHLPIIVALSGLVIVFPEIIPSPDGGAGWWLYRFLLLIPIALLVFVISLPLAKYEAGPTLQTTPRWGVLIPIICLALVAPFVATEFSLSYSQIVWGSVLLAVCVKILIGKKTLTEKTYSS